MGIPFKKIGLAITFSPTGKALLYEAGRLVKLFAAEIVLIHNGEKTLEAETKLAELIESAGFNFSSVNIEWVKGDIADTIINKAGEKKVDLLLVGALEKENIIKYYSGSVARKIMRQAGCSVLVLTSPSETPVSFKKFCVSVDYSMQSENAIKTAYDLAMLEKAEKLILIREIQAPGLAMTVQDSGSMREVELARQTWAKEEKDKMEMLIKEMNLTEIDIETHCLYGKEGYEANKFVEQINGDIFVVPAPQKKLKLFDRIFQHDFEFTLKQIPCPVLIIRNPGK